MLFGSSYSLLDGVTSSEIYGFEVSNSDVEFQDNTKITIGGIPLSDEEGIKTSKEFTFTVANNSKNDVNYRLDIVENSAFKMADVIKYVYKLNDDEYSETYLLEDRKTIRQDKVLKSGSKDVYKLKMWLSLDADESVMNKQFVASIKLQASQNDFKYATSVIDYLHGKDIDNIKKDGEDYRYGGNNPNNYVWFNCKDNYSKGRDNCEVWRIIGSFDNTYEGSKERHKSLKIVRYDMLEDVAFNNEEMSGDYDNSYINTFLNGAYYDKLSTSSQNLLLKANWNIGKINTNNYSNASFYEGNKNYYAYVGLPSVSDYLYLEKDNYLKSYENVLLLNKTMDNVNVINDGIKSVSGLIPYNYLPCVYLKYDVSILSGDGSIDYPYELGIKFPMNYNNKK